MRKFIKPLMMAGVTLALFGGLLVGCGNRQIFDTTYTFEKAIIIIGDERIEVHVESWKDYEDTTIQIETKDGKTYLTDIKNVLMMTK